LEHANMPEFPPAKPPGAITQADALLGFSESGENQAAVIGAISHGISYSLFG
jgi:hypothetical protein